MLKTNILVVILIHNVFAGNVLANRNLNVSLIHERAENLMNTFPDSSLILLTLASIKIGQIENLSLKASYQADNNLLRAAYWTERNYENALPFLKDAYNYYQANPDNLKLAKTFYCKARIAWLSNKIDIVPTLMDRALYYGHKQNEYECTSLLYCSYGMFWVKQERWQKGYEKARNALKFALLSNDSLAISGAHALLAKVYEYYNLYNKSENNFLKAITYGNGSWNIWPLYEAYGDLLGKDERPLESLRAFERALSLAKASRLGEKSMIRLRTKIGESLLKAGLIDDALNNYQIMINTGHLWKYETTKDIFLIYQAKILASIGDYVSAICSMEEVDLLNRTPALKAKYINELLSFAQIYDRAGLEGISILYYEKWSKLSDSLYTYNIAQQIGNMEDLYIKEKEYNELITANNIALSLSKKQQSLMGLGIIILTIISGSIIYILRIRSLKEKDELKLSVKANQLQQVLSAQEQERQRLARELHDGICQSLVALKMQMEISKDYKTSPTTISKMDALCREVRTLSHQMMPKTLEQHGLKNALPLLVMQSLKPKGIKAEIVVDGLEERLDSIKEIHLYRIGQELINNIIRHSEANEVGIQLLEQSGKVILIIEDDGKGFSVESKRDGIGLANIQSRLDAISGKMEMHSAPGEGTYTRIVVPISNEDRRTA